MENIEASIMVAIDKLETIKQHLMTTSSTNNYDGEMLAVNVAMLIIMMVTASYVASQVRAMRGNTESAQAAARTRATVDLILHTQTNESHCSRRNKYLALRAGDDGIAALVPHAHKAGKDNESAAIVREILNHYEMVAIGIDTGIIDEPMYMRYYKSTLVKDWEECQTFIQNLRKFEKSNSFYCEFEKLAKKWIET